MKLQINLKGSWRDVLTFPPERQALIETHAAALLADSGSRAAMRLATDDNECLAICKGPDFVWRLP